MNADKFVNVLTSIVAVAMVTTVVANPNSAAVLRAFGEAFSGSIRSAMGR